MLNVSSLKILLEREEQHKQELVVLVETSARVAKHLVRQELDHVVQSLRGERRLLRSAQRPCRLRFGATVKALRRDECSVTD